MSEQPPQERLEPVFQTRIFIEKDGTVVFENLAEELLPLARALDPDFELGLLRCAVPAADCAASDRAPEAEPRGEGLPERGPRHAVERG